MHRALSSQPLSDSALICRDLSKSFLPGSGGECLQLLPGLLPTHHILLAAASTVGGTNEFSVIYLLITDLWHCIGRSLAEAGAEFVPFRGVI